MTLSLWSDIKKSYKMLGVALHFAWGDTKARYSRSFLGPFWIVLATMIGVVGLGFVWGTVFNQPFKEIIPSITLGLVFWNFMSGCIVEAPTIFVSNASIIKGHPTPYIFFVFKHLFKHLIMLAHNALIIIAICIFFGILKSHLDYLLFLIGFSLVLANLFWLSLALALMGVRFRDIELILGSVMPLIFFLTPVIFKSQQVESIKMLMYINPFSSFIRVMRDPLYSGLTAYEPLWVCLIILIVGIILTPIIYRKMIKEVPYLV